MLLKSFKRQQMVLEGICNLCYVEQTTDFNVRKKILKQKTSELSLL